MIKKKKKEHTINCTIHKYKIQIGDFLKFRTPQNILFLIILILLYCSFSLSLFMILPFMNNAVDIGDTTGVTGSSFENKDVLSFFNRANFKHRMFEEMKKKKLPSITLRRDSSVRNSAKSQMTNLFIQI